MSDTVGGPRLGDECFTLHNATTDTDTTYWFMFPEAGGPLSFASANPFAPKTTTGERAYADYDAHSIIAMTTLAGGMGQERLVDVTKYYDARNVDTRGGRIVLGPYINVGEPLGFVNEDEPPMPPPTIVEGVWVIPDFSQSSYTLTANHEAALPVGVTLTGAVRHVWLPLAGRAIGSALTGRICADDGGAPGLTLATISFDTTWFDGRVRWQRGTLSADWTPTATDFIVLSLAADATGHVQWGGWLITTNSGYVLPGYGQGRDLAAGSWANISYALQAWFEPEDVGGEPMNYLIGAGEDGVSRMWATAGRRLFYFDANSLATAVEDGAGAVKDLGGEAACAIFYQAEADTFAYLYIGRGDDANIQKFNANIGAEVWDDTTDLHARCMCKHDGLLFMANATNEVFGWDGATAGSSIGVGDKQYPVRNLASWDNYLWAGKDDGLYRIVLPAGYPGVGDLEAQRVIDFAALANVNNFRAMCVHQGDLYFSLSDGLVRYTTGSVVTPVTPEIGLNVSLSERAGCTALVSSLSALWAAFEGRMTGDSTICARVEGAWHPIITLARTGDMIRSLALDPGWYEDVPRLWFTAGLSPAHVQMPVTTQRRWLWSDLDYASTGYLDTSWIDGNIRTIDKDWLKVEVDHRIPSSDLTIVDGVWVYDNVLVSWRPDEETDWEDLGRVASFRGLTSVDFPEGSYGKKAQLRLTFTTYHQTYTPQVEAIVVHYMERPEDLRSFTRTYEISDFQTWRNGSPILEDVATRIGHLRTLRESREPLSFQPWTGELGDTYVIASNSYPPLKVHIVNYSASERVDERGDKDRGRVIVTLQLQVVA